MGEGVGLDHGPALGRLITYLSYHSITSRRDPITYTSQCTASQIEQEIDGDRGIYDGKHAL
jgi:hypothetical protein